MIVFLLIAAFVLLIIASIIMIHNLFDDIQQSKKLQEMEFKLEVRREVINYLNELLEEFEKRKENQNENNNWYVEI